MKRRKREANIKFKENNPHYNKDYHNRPKVRARRKERDNRPENLSKKKEYMKLWIKNNKDKVDKHELKRRFSLKRINYNKKYDPDYRIRPEVKKRQKEFNQRPEQKLKRKNHYDIRRKNDEAFRIKLYLRNRLGFILKKYTKSKKIMSSKTYGLNFEAIIKHLQPFPDNLELYHIDHIRPLCSFNFINQDGSQNLEEIKKAFAPENHQWLLASENISKGGRWEEPLEEEKINI